MSAAIVVVTPEALGELVRAAVAEALALRDSPQRSEPARLTLKEAADMMRCSQRNVRRLLATGRLRSAKLSTGGSSRVLIARSDIERLLQESST